MTDFYLPLSAGDVMVMTLQVEMQDFRLEGSLGKGIACDSVNIHIKKLCHIFKIEINFL